MDFISKTIKVRNTRNYQAVISFRASNLTDDLMVNFNAEDDHMAHVRLRRIVTEYIRNKLQYHTVFKADYYPYKKYDVFSFDYT